MSSKIRIKRNEFGDNAYVFDISLWVNGNQLSFFATDETDAWVFAEKLQKAIDRYTAEEVPEITSDYV